MANAGSEITSTNDDASFAKANAKQRLIDTGTAIQAATKQLEGQAAHATDTSSGKKRGYEYLVSQGQQLWYPTQADILNGVYGDLFPCSDTFATSFQGMFTAGTAYGSTTQRGSYDTTDGNNYIFTTGASSGNQAGFRTGFTWLERNQNAMFRSRFKLSSSATQTRLVLGFVASTSTVGNTDDPFNASGGFAIGKQTTSANFRILHNDGAGVTASDDTGIAVDTNTHQIDLWADANGNQFYWSLDFSTPVAVTTDINGATTAFCTQATITTNEGVAKTLTLYQCYAYADR